MRDFNFFSPYIEVKKSIKFKTFYIVIIACSVVLLFSSLLLVNQYRISKMNAEIKTQTAYLSAPGTVSKLNEYDETKRKVQILNEYSTIVVNINRQMDDQDLIGTRLLSDIAKSMPEGTFFKSLSISSDGIQLQGVSNSRTAIAELEHNFIKLGTFSSVYVSSIAQDTSSLNNVDAAGQAGAGTVKSGSNNYTFVLTCKLGDVKK